MSPIEHRRLPPHARQVASCSGFSKVHLEQGVIRCDKVHLYKIVFKGEDCASLFYLRHDHMLKAAGSSSWSSAMRLAVTLSSSVTGCSSGSIAPLASLCRPPEPLFL